MINIAALWITKKW